MKTLVKLCAGIVLVTLIAACSQQSTEEPTAAAPTETAEEFVTRANAELKDLGRELGAASWVRSTYITQDTAIIASAAGEKYAKWCNRPWRTIARNWTHQPAARLIC